MKNITVFIAFTLAIGTMLSAKAQQKIIGDDFMRKTEMLNNDGSSVEEARSIQVHIDEASGEESWNIQAYNDEVSDKEGWSELASKRWQSLIEDTRKTLKRELEN